MLFHVFLLFIGKLKEVIKPTESRKYWVIDDVRLVETFSGDLGVIVVECCSDISLLKNLNGIMPIFNKENPYKAKETEGEFFACGFLTNTNIYVVDSVVKKVGTFTHIIVVFSICQITFATRVRKRKSTVYEICSSSKRLND